MLLVYPRRLITHDISPHFLNVQFTENMVAVYTGIEPPCEGLGLFADASGSYDGDAQQLQLEFPGGFDGGAVLLTVQCNRTASQPVFVSRPIVLGRNPTNVEMVAVWNEPGLCEGLGGRGSAPAYVRGRPALVRGSPGSGSKRQLD